MAVADPVEQSRTATSLRRRRLHNSNEPSETVKPRFSGLFPFPTSDSSIPDLSRSPFFRGDLTDLGRQATAHKVALFDGDNPHPLFRRDAAGTGVLNCLVGPKHRKSEHVEPVIGDHV